MRIFAALCLLASTSFAAKAVYGPALTGGFGDRDKGRLPAEEPAFVPRTPAATGCTQNDSFNPSWATRGSRAPVTSPKVEAPFVAPMLDQLVWLNVLNVSKRNCSFMLSFRLKFLNIERSQR